MQFKIFHKTIYRFEAPVFLEPHYLRFKPRSAPHLAVKSFDLKISPEVAGISEHVDPEDNILHLCWFEGQHDRLEITMEMVLVSEEYHPFNFLVYPLEYSQCPFTYSADLRQCLGATLQPLNIGEPLRKFGGQVLQEAGNNTITFLTEITRKIHQRFTVESRETGQPHKPDDTFSLKKGSCRDLAWMQIHLLRSMGFAARFVSGYYYLIVDEPAFELHAWLEVYIPGGGWFGLDPSHGSVTSHTHLPAASSAHFENTMPVSGTLRGAAQSAMDSQVLIEIEEG